MGYFRYEDIADIGPRITTFASWRSEMKKLAEKAIKEGRHINGAFFYRAAEFYTFDEAGEKEKLYEQFTEYFYKTIKNDKIDILSIPYESGALSAMRIPAIGKKTGTILLHGGFDSFIEEWYLMMKYLARKGFEVIGVSPDSVASHKKFADKYNFGFNLIADTEKEILQAYGAWGEKNMYGRKYMGVIRTTFIIDNEGKVEEIFEKVKTKDHTNQIISTLE